MKLRILAWLESKGHTVMNLGVDTDDRVDYPDMADKAVAEFLKGGYDLGILFCGTGIGISIAANRHRGIRCALIHDVFTSLMAKEHNDANFLALGGRVSYTVPPESLIETFLGARFQGGRHSERLKKLDRL